MTLEVGQRDENVGIHDGAADLRLLDVLAADHRHGNVVGSLKAVADQDRAADGHRREPVLPRAVQVLKGVLAASGVHGIAVSQEGLAALLLDKVRDSAGVIRAQKAQVAQLAEVHLNRDELPIEVHLIHTGGFQKPAELLRKPLAQTASKIGKIYAGLLFFFVHRF